jgi:hypothetical protein
MLWGYWVVTVRCHGCSIPSMVMCSIGVCVAHPIRRVGVCGVHYIVQGFLWWLSCGLDNFCAVLGRDVF